MKWFPWRFIVRRLARSQGFLDPVLLLTNLQRFSQPSEVMAPTELLRAGAVLQARGLMNSQAIQHNLDWIWPFWVERQFDPRDDAFVPRAFNLTHINLTHRNWTAVGVPDCSELPIVDPRGLVTPLYDGWSLDAWVYGDDGKRLLPSRERAVEQRLRWEENLSVATATARDGMSLVSRAEVKFDTAGPRCRVTLDGRAEAGGWLVLSLRPCNPEGVAFVHELERSTDRPGWKVNRKERVVFSEAPDRQGFSEYRLGDVSRALPDVSPGESIQCNVGMATAAALFRLEPGRPRTIAVDVPLPKCGGTEPEHYGSWKTSLQGHARLEVPDELYQFLYDAALRSLVLHSPGDVYPGPYTYKRFWFRDAAFILHAMMCVGLADRAERVIDRFPSRQTPFGYFLSQEGEWDSNGQALWTMRRFCELTGRAPKQEWMGSISRAARWIQRKRLSEKSASPHAGLLPPGFSAEHLGPNDYYYWDDFWGVGGLRAASYLAGRAGDAKAAAEFGEHADSFLRAIERSVETTASATHAAIPASPYRRMDAGSIGSVAGSYPLKLWSSTNRRMLNTVDFLLKTSFFDGGFFQEISHSGVNPYLSLHVAQVLLRANDPRALEIADAIAALASPTGQWPEAVHPRTKGGCMGDGQHVWAAAEWVLLVRNFFMREEEGEQKLILGSGIPPRWLKPGGRLTFGLGATTYGDVSVAIEPHASSARVSWTAEWRGQEPAIEIRLPGFARAIVAPGALEVTVERTLEGVAR